MATNYPTNLDNLTDPTSGQPTNSPSHAGLHTAANDAIVAIETYVGTNPIQGGDTSSISYKLNGVSAPPAAANGLATLDGSGRVPVSELPLISTTTLRPTTGPPTSLSTDQTGDFACDASAQILYGPFSGTGVSGTWPSPGISLGGGGSGGGGAGNVLNAVTQFGSYNIDNTGTVADNSANLTAIYQVAASLGCDIFIPNQSNGAPAVVLIQNTIQIGNGNPLTASTIPGVRLLGAGHPDGSTVVTGGAAAITGADQFGQTIIRWNGPASQPSCKVINWSGTLTTSSNVTLQMSGTVDASYSPSGTATYHDVNLGTEYLLTYGGVSGASITGCQLTSIPTGFSASVTPAYADRVNNQYAMVQINGPIQGVGFENITFDGGAAATPASVSTQPVRAILNYSGQFTKYENLAFFNCSCAIQEVGRTYSPSTTYTGSNGTALSALSTLPIAGTAGGTPWPPTGSGTIVAGGTTHTFTYTGVNPSGLSLTGCAYSGTTSDTVSSNAVIVNTAAVADCLFSRGNKLWIQLPTNGIGPSLNDAGTVCTSGNYGSTTTGLQNFGIIHDGQVPGSGAPTNTCFGDWSNIWMSALQTGTCENVGVTFAGSDTIRYRNIVANPTGNGTGTYNGRISFLQFGNSGFNGVESHVVEGVDFGGATRTAATYISAISAVTASVMSASGASITVSSTAAPKNYDNSAGTWTAGNWVDVTGSLSSGTGNWNSVLGCYQITSGNATSFTYVCAASPGTLSGTPTVSGVSVIPTAPPAYPTTFRNLAMNNGFHGLPSNTFRTAAIKWESPWSGGQVTPVSIPGSGTSFAAQNNTNANVLVNIVAGGAISNITLVAPSTIAGSTLPSGSTGMTVAAGASLQVRLPFGWAISLNWSGSSPSWTWFAD